MIPPFGLSGALPPFVGTSAADMRGVSPYLTSMSEIAMTLATSTERAKLCKGLLEHRKALRNLGVVQGIQWINGSYCENVEVTRGRPPADIDIVTLLARPTAHQDDAAWTTLINANMSVFVPHQAKAKYGCDAYFVDLNQPLSSTISFVTYWFGLFTHQRTTSLWKGILQVPLLSDDLVAEAHLTHMLLPPALVGPP